MAQTNLWTYNALDCVTTARCFESILEELGELNLVDFYHEIPHPLIQAVRRMQLRGMFVDQQFRAQAIAEREEKIRELTEVIRQLADDPEFNPNSPDQLCKLLFDKMKLPVIKRSPKTHKPSTDELVLKTLNARYPNPLFNSIIKQREVSKEKSTYLDSIRVDNNGRMHYYALVHGTATGRLATRKPNTQNIPYSLRPMYCAAPGNLLVAADASQLELRLIAYASRCAKLMEAFDNGEDVHTINAVAITGKPKDAISKDDRDFAKRFIYCQNYGGGAKRISEILFEEANIIRSVRECEETLTRLRKAYPEIYEWRDRMLAETRVTRRIRNEFGRIRITFAKGEDLAGIAYNTPIQGTAADYINKAFIRLDARQVPLINQVHDELIAECSEHAAREVGGIILEELHRPINIFGRSVVLPAELKIGTRWGQLEKVDLKSLEGETGDASITRRAD